MALMTSFGDYESDLAFLQGKLNSLKSALLTIQKYGERPGTWSMDQVRVAYRDVLNRLQSLRSEVSGREMPSAFMMALSNFSDDAISFGNKIGSAAVSVVEAAGSAAGGIARTANWLPFILIGALVVVGLGFAKGGLKVEKRF